jgi:hypothetical protein
VFGEDDFLINAVAVLADDQVFGVDHEPRSAIGPKGRGRLDHYRSLRRLGKCSGAQDGELLRITLDRVWMLGF